jgi:outer membrane protein OmpA-like peptidoglycan-associated protein
MRYTVTAAAGVALLASMVPAGAQLLPAPTGPVNWTGPYVGLSIGGDWGRLPGRDRVPGTAVSAPGSVGYGSATDTEPTGGGQAGYNYQLPSNIVLGVEADVKGGGPSVTTRTGGSGPIGAGSTIQSSSTVNGSFRGRIGYAWNQFMVYGTGGIAVADGNLQANYTSAAPGLPGGARSNSTVLVGPTFGGGVEYAIAPNVTIGGEYRHTDYSTQGMRLGPVYTAGGPQPAFAKIALQDDVALLKVNYHFNAPPPPPPPMPAAMPAPPPSAPRVFIVFFDWDKDSITPQGMQIVRQAADAYRSGAPVQIQVTGYTDRSGSAAYNQRLSERRANNVAKALSSLGVPREQMAVSGRGENDNRVPTAAGVREPQNRRVEITAP